MKSSSSSFFDAIFVVNLRRRPDRWKSITEQCQRAGLQHQSLHRVDAYDGSLFSMAGVKRSGLVSSVGIDRMTTLPESQRVWGMDLSPGAVGCALSHTDIWCSVLEQRLERALVLEDDCILPESSSSSSFHSLVEKSIWPSVPRDWEFVFLSGLDPEQQCKFLRVAKTADTSRFVCRVPRIYRTTNCYVVNWRGAESLLRNCTPFTFQLDTAMTTMLTGAADEHQQQKKNDDASVLPNPKLFPAAEFKALCLDQQVTMTTEFASLIPCYCVDPPLAAQATRFGSDIQWKNPHAAPDHDFGAEEKSRLSHAGIE